MPTTPATIATTAGQTVARELLIAYLNTGTSSSPVWSAFGKRVEDSSMEFDWSEETTQDILGDSHSTVKKPKITQGFEPLNLDSADSAATKIWEIAVRDHDVQALANMDVMVAHFYAEDGDDAAFAERYPSSLVVPTGLGGEGGGSIEMPINVTYGGTRVKGTVARDSSTGAVTFTPES